MWRNGVVWRSLLFLLWGDCWLDINSVGYGVSGGGFGWEIGIEF